MAVHRLAEAERSCCDWLLRAGDDAFLARVRISRALELQLLLSSATARLGGWCDRCPLEQLPASHLFEWVSYDLERLELAQLEDAMHPEEAALYAFTFDQENARQR